MMVAVEVRDNSEEQSVHGKPGEWGGIVIVEELREPLLLREFEGD
jgi:hypothetical protein